MIDVSTRRRPRAQHARRRWAYAVVSVLATSSGLAHHSISGVYDSGRQVTVQGRVVEFQFVNPHPVLIVATDADAGAASETWWLEMDNRYELADIGVTAATFEPGDRVVATGSAARADARSLYLMKLDRPADGLRYEQVGTSPRISHAER